MGHAQSPHGLDRRAIPQRSSTWAARAADLLAAARIRPNHISISSIVLGALAGVAFALSATESTGARIAWLLIAAATMPLRLLMNMVDGMLAVEKGMSSPTGDLYNEVPDRLADVFVLAGAGYGVSGLVALGRVDVGVALGWSAALLAVLTAYVRSLGAAQGVKNFFAGPMPKPIRMWVMTAAALVSMLEPALGITRGWVIVVGLIVVALGSLATVIIRLRLIAAALHAKAAS
ncbi:hypothetical protein BSZ39_04110 [Bowdeniella nasicola]|uniref:Phosphatidylglycerophosphate synthase n=1 Tax=Bowdeniella nasicola TaxID=208480 RepID=A0A1Q5Q3P8_9ACTO|nr:CDP-alcohol phosphatidyltransferase family protein [Bowdeniella nasicola]OKL54417.1 hypothetical protein BSZ39_04110 [Bowdeniella nasicola]